MINAADLRENAVCWPLGFFFANTQSLRIISLIGIRMSTEDDTTHDTDTRGVNIVHETDKHEKLDPDIKNIATHSDRRSNPTNN